MTDRDRLIELLGLRLPINVRNLLGSYDTIGERTLAVDEREKLADYLLANGVILPPCKVGDTVWFICFGKIYPHEIKKIETSEFGKFACSSMVFNFEDFGKTVFLTKEDAEEKLKELSDNK